MTVDQLVTMLRNTDATGQGEVTIDGTDLLVTKPDESKAAIPVGAPLKV